MAWRLHADPAMMVAGMRALMVQALEPRAMAGVAEHSDYRADPWRRLDRTVRFILATTYGDTATAEGAAAAVRAIHERVRGTDPVSGRAYAASEPDLLLWVHAVEVHSVVVAYRRYAGRLTDDDADRYVAETRCVPELLGLPVGAAPESMGELRAYLRSMDDRLVVTPAARRALRLILAPPVPIALRPFVPLPVAAAVAVLPRIARRLYHLPWPAPATPSVRAATYTLTRVLNLTFADAPEVRAARARVRPASVEREGDRDGDE